MDISLVSDSNFKILSDEQKFTYAFSIYGSLCIFGTFFDDTFNEKLTEYLYDNYFELMEYIHEHEDDLYIKASQSINRI